MLYLITTIKAQPMYTLALSKNFKRIISRRGFTLVDTMIVVGIIGLLILISIPALFHARESTQNSLFMNELRLLNTAIDSYVVTAGTLPNDVAPGKIPAGFQEHLGNRVKWSGEPDIGGQWDWERSLDETVRVFDCCEAAWAVVAPDRTTEQMATIDYKLDDGNLLTGRFRRSGTTYFMIVQ